MIELTFLPWNQHALNRPGTPQYWSKTGQRVFVYLLVDPRDETARYVGVTNNPDVRLAQHMRAEQNNPRMRSWIEGLKNIQSKPRMFVIGHANAETWQAAEKAWIGWFRNRADIYNIGSGGRAWWKTKKQEPNPYRAPETEQAKSLKRRLHGQIDHLGVYRQDVLKPLGKKAKAKKNREKRAAQQLAEARGVKPALRQAMPTGGFTLRELNDEVRAELEFRAVLKRA